MKRLPFPAHLFCCMILLLYTGCSSDENRITVSTEDTISDQELQNIYKEHKPNTFVFGFDLRSSPEEDARQYLPFLVYMHEKTGYDFQLKLITDSMDIVESLGTGSVHFAAIGAGTYIQANINYGIVPLVRGLNFEGKAEYRSVIVVSPNSRIKRIKDLKGTRFAFGSYTSTQGHIIPRIVFNEHGISLTDLGSYIYTGSHAHCATEVVSGRVDACGMQDTMGRELEADGLVRILHTSRYYPSSGIAANKGVSQEVIHNVQKALLAFQPKGNDAARLYNWDRTEMPNGFTPAHDEDYDELRKWAIKLGIVKVRK